MMDPNKPVEMTELEWTKRKLSLTEAKTNCIVQFHQIEQALIQLEAKKPTSEVPPPE